MITPSIVPSSVYIYGLVDPRDKQVRYVGRTISPTKRLSNHCSPSHRYENGRKGVWLSDLHANGFIPGMVILEVVSKENWQHREKYWIRYLNTQGNDLFNVSVGGEGGDGWELTTITRERMSKAQKGKIMSLESRNKMSRPKPNRRGEKRSYEHRVKISSSKCKNAGQALGIREKKGKWQARTAINGHRYSLGTFTSQDEATKAIKSFLADATAKTDGLVPTIIHTITCKRCKTAFEADSCKPKLCPPCRIFNKREAARRCDAKRRPRNKKTT